MENLTIESAPQRLHLEQGLGLTAHRLAELRHEIRNHLNIIKLSCAVLQRQRAADPDFRESLLEIEKSADGINHLISRLRAESHGHGQ